VGTAAAHDVVEPVISGPEVSVTAGLADDAAPVEQPRDSLKQTIPNSLGKTDIRATHIPDGCESTIEARMQKRCGKVRQIRDGRLCQTRNIQARQVNVNVSVNQAWHQHPATAIDDFCIRDYDVRDGNYILDGWTRDHNIVAFDEPVGFAVEDTR
jgi:hypothetical protein